MILVVGYCILLSSKIFSDTYTCTATDNKNHYFEYRNTTNFRCLSVLAHRGYNGKYGTAIGWQFIDKYQGYYRALVLLELGDYGVEGQLFYLYLIKC